MLRVIGVVLAALVVLLLLALCLRVGVNAEKDREKTQVYLRYGPFRFRVYPLRRAAAKEEHSPKSEAAQPSAPKQSSFSLKNVDWGDLLHLMLEMLEEGKRAIKIDRLHLQMQVASADAAATGLLYGQIMALAGMIYPFLAQNFKIKDCRIVIEPDFEHQKLAWTGALSAAVRPIRLMAIAVRHLGDFYRIYRQIQKDEAKTNERKQADE